jgi:hypothetical protein
MSPQKSALIPGASKTPTDSDFTLVRITRPGCASVLLRIPASVDWVEVVERCAKVFSGDSKNTVNGGLVADASSTTLPLAGTVPSKVDRQPSTKCPLCHKAHAPLAGCAVTPQ